ncbi:MAG TPA: hypothetical protein VK746_05285 [Candidatus Eisenbacteria bacterium]|nr:hypothetical protein [Candidatus Eisenbacteria bacterium]
MLDAAALEKRGIHTVTIVWDNFENAARMQARLQNVPDLALVVIPHRKGGETADDQRRKAEAALAQIVAALLR